MQLFLRSFLAAYPVRAGIVLGMGEKARGEKCFPRMRGDISSSSRDEEKTRSFPRMRGDISGAHVVYLSRQVFSPHARGYFYRIPKWQIGIWCTPLARG